MLQCSLMTMLAGVGPFAAAPGPQSAPPPTANDKAAPWGLLRIFPTLPSRPFSQRKSCLESRVNLEPDNVHPVVNVSNASPRLFSD